MTIFHAPRASRLLVILLSIVSLALGSCASPKKAPPDEAEKWKSLAEQSKGYSPSQDMPDDKRLVEIPSPPVAKIEVKDERQLNPNNRRVTLKLHDVDLPVMIQALAMAADQPILMNAQDLESRKVSINVKDKPWDSVFLGILRTHGLYYVWEGQGQDAILRVVDKKILDSEREVSEMLGRDMTTSVIKVNYLNLSGSQPQRSGTSTTSSGSSSSSSSSGSSSNSSPSPMATQSSGTSSTNVNSIVESVLSKDKSGNPRGSVLIDTQNNAIILTASREDTQKALEMVKVLDQPRPQIRLSANIVETTKETARSLGVQWAGNYAPQFGHNTFSTTSQSYVTSTGSTTGTNTQYYNYGQGMSGTSQTGQFTYFPSTLSQFKNGVGGGVSFMYGTIGKDILEMQLSAMQQDNKLHILSSPTITTMDNVMAYTENGEKVPYVTETTDSSGQKTQTVNFETAVMRLEITPHVIDSNSLKLNILVKKDEVDQSRSVNGNPYILKKQTETTLIVGNNDTIVISGLTKQSNLKTIQGIPGLKDIPGLGWLFKTDDKDDKMEDVLIFITPEILRTRPPLQPAPQAEQPSSLENPAAQGTKLAQ